jgi:hypothetical protein
MRWWPVGWTTTALLMAVSMPPGVLADSINDKIDKELKTLVQLKDHFE